MPRGGARLNTGPKGKHKKTLEAEAARELLKTMVFAELGPIVNAQLDLAKGHLLQTTKDGTIYSKSPDKGAAELLFNHAIGKPKESVELIGEIKIDVDIKKTIEKVYGDIN
jgi:hypothetical protein